MFSPPELPATSPQTKPPSVEVERLTLAAGPRLLLRDLNLRVEHGQAVAILGESGAGKSLLLRAVAGILPGGVQPVQGKIRLSGRLQPLQVGFRPQRRHASALGAGFLSPARSEETQSRVRLGWVAQHAALSFDPLRTVGEHLAEALGAASEGLGSPRGVSQQACQEWLDRVGLPSSVLRSYAHELSGGMARRAALAWALAGGASLMLADEPSNGADPIRLREMLELLRLMGQQGLALVVVTHEARLARGLTEAVFTLEQGRLVPGISQVRRLRRRGEAAELLRNTPPPPPLPLPSPVLVPFATEASAIFGANVLHRATEGPPPWQRELVSPEPTLPGGSTSRMPSLPVLRVQGLTHFMPGRQEPILKQLNWQLHRRERVGVAGLSGCGKSTLLRLVAGLLPLQQGRMTRLTSSPLRCQVVLQEPGAALHPRLTVQQALQETLRTHQPQLRWEEQQERLEVALGQTHLRARAHALAHELSGGELRRLGLIRALLAQPDLLLLDEPTNGLDPGHQRRLLNLIDDWLPSESCMVLISHDFELLMATCSRLDILHEGDWAESLVVRPGQVLQPQTHITRQLLAAWEALSP